MLDGGADRPEQHADHGPAVRPSGPFGGACTTVLAAAVAGAVLWGQSNAAAAQDVYNLGTGGVTGVYYPTGGAIQLLVNRSMQDHGVRLAVEPTDGSVANLNAIAAGDMAFAIVQSDWQYHAYNGSDDAFPEANPGLRSVFSLYGEPLTIVARADADIEAVTDLPGTRVNIGNPGSGQRATMTVLMEAQGWTAATFGDVFELPPLDQSAALCADAFDAMVFVAGHPSGSVQQATTACPAVLVPAQDDAIDALVAANDYYAYTTIPGGTYPGTPDDVVTFGVKATFVTSAAVPDEVVYQIVRSVFEDIDVLRTLHPALTHLDPQDMIGDALSAPLHDGAVRYYQERGWM